MKKICFLLFASLLVACDDGDIITEEFDFEDTAVSSREPLDPEDSRRVVFYKNKRDTREALILSFDINDDFLTNDGSGRIELGETNILEYRRFNVAPQDEYFSQLVPPVEPRVEEVFNATAGTLVFSTTIVEDDNDGIPRELEFDGDTDGDGIDDYLDLDDDGDNVPTSSEITRDEETGDLIDFIDTDGDGTPNHLDTDDDGDGILTRQEDLDRDGSPLDDISDTNSELPNYLNPAVSDAASPRIPDNERVQHIFTRNYEITLIINNLVLTNDSEEFVFDRFEFGTYSQENTLTIQFN